MSTYPRDVLAAAARESTSLIDLMRRVGAPLGGKPRSYLRHRLSHYGIDTSHFQEEPLPERPKRSYSKAILAEAAAHSGSIREMFLHMGIPPEDGPYQHVKRRLTHFGIDTSHFRQPRAPHHPDLFPRRELATAVEAAHSLADLMRHMGYPAFNGAARARAVRSITAHGLSTEHFTGQAHNAGRRSPARRSAEDILVRHPAHARRTRTVLLRRALDDMGTPRQCVRCGLGEIWQGKRLVLEVDHINGDRLDDRRENLRYLCPNCHALTGTWCRGGRRAPLAVGAAVH